MPLSDYIRNLRAHVGHDLLMVPCVAAVVRNERGEMLLQQHRDSRLWSLPAGAIDPGETPSQAVVREVREETGLIVRPVRIAGVFGGADGFRFRYANGDLVEYLCVMFDCAITGGELGAFDEETLRLEYFAINAMPALPIGYSRRVFELSRAGAMFECDGEWIESL